MSFVLVDYKGGAAFRDCERLPHTVGTVTDLDGHLTERALRSLGAELRRRESVLRSFGCKDLDDYDAAAPAGSPPMPRLVLVVDEFATLVEELPDFVGGLVGIAQRGRSLGVHLVLATQRPGGVVSADIRANTSLRIALRVTDPAESSDVVDVRDAADIGRAHPGRAVVRVGPGVVRRCSRPGSAGTPAAATPVSVRGRAVGRGRRPGGAGRRTTAPAGPHRPGAAGRRGPRRRRRLRSGSRSRAPGSLRCRGVVTVDDLPGGHRSISQVAAGRPRPAGRAAPGRGDLRPCRRRPPARRRRGAQRPAHRCCGPWRPGSPRPVRRHRPAPLRARRRRRRAGAADRTSALRGRGRPRRDGARRPAAAPTGATRSSAASGCSPAAGSRLARGAAPRRAAGRPAALAGAAGRRLGGHGHARSRTVDHGRPLDTLLRLVREGAGGRGPRRPDRGPDRAHRAGRLGVPRPAGAAAQRPGRLRVGRHLAPAGAHRPARRDGRWSVRDALEAQLLVLDVDTSGEGQVRALEAVAATARARPPVPHGHRGLRPMRVDPLPGRVEVVDIEAAAKAACPGRSWALVGLGGDELAPVGADLDVDGPAFVIAGPAGSGRSTALATMGRWLLGQGRATVVVAHRRSPLQRLAGEPGVLGGARCGRRRPGSSSCWRAIPASWCWPTTPRRCTTPPSSGP